MVLKPEPEIQYHPLSRDALHAISTEFLASEKLAHAPLAEKKEFLKAKGLSEDEIETLLQRVVAAADSEVSSSRMSTPASSDTGTTTEERVENNEEKGLVPRELKEVPPIISLYPHSLKPLILTRIHRFAPPHRPLQDSNPPLSNPPTSNNRSS